MILDASAILSVILADPDSGQILQQLSDAPILCVGAPTLVETAVVLSSRLRRDPRALLNEFLREAEVEVIPATLRFTAGRAFPSPNLFC